MPALSYEILHPYGGRKDGEDWIVTLYTPFQRAYIEMPERDFIALPVVTAADVRAGPINARILTGPMSNSVTACSTKSGPMTGPSPN